MSTTQNPSAAVTAQITEADVAAFFLAITDKYAPQFPEVRELCATTSLGRDSFRVGFFGYKDDRFSAVTAYGNTFEEAASDLRKQLGTPEEKVAKLREQAAAMLAEAEQIQNGRAA